MIESIFLEPGKQLLCKKNEVITQPFRLFPIFRTLKAAAKTPRIRLRGDKAYRFRGLFAASDQDLRRQLELSEAVAKRGYPAPSSQTNRFSHMCDGDELGAL
jgi:hypothetical protein